MKAVTLKHTPANLTLVKALMYQSLVPERSGFTLTSQLEEAFMQNLLHFMSVTSVQDEATGTLYKLPSDLRDAAVTEVVNFIITAATQSAFSFVFEQRCGAKAAFDVITDIVLAGMQSKQYLQTHLMYGFLIPLTQRRLWIKQDNVRTLLGLLQSKHNSA